MDAKTDISVACERAADAISAADVFVLCTGAGFSADSGLAVYADVAQIDAYAKLNMKYHDLCNPRWLSEWPELFWGFWGQCFNDYRNTEPHGGYAMINRWADRLFRNTPLGDSIRRDMECAMSEDDAAMNPYIVEDMPSAFFAFTSNVDAHHFDWFRAGEIRECHGNVEIYQCGTDEPCTEAVWRAPSEFRFQIDKATMLAPAYVPADVPEQNNEHEVSPAAAVPKIGMVREGIRSQKLKYMPDDPQQDPNKFFEMNHPVCRSCGGPARPAILMFGDCEWQDLESQENRWEYWCRVVEKHADRGVPVGESTRPLRVAVLEIGAGDRVPTVRYTSETCCQRFLEHGACASLIRINPEIPFGDAIEFEKGGIYEDNLISIKCSGLDVLRRIDALLGRTQSTESPEQESDGY